MAGRPTKLNDETQRIICEAIGDCLPKHMAATLAGISRMTLHRWERRGQAGDEPYASFCYALKEAEVKAQLTLARRIADPDPDKTRGWQRWAWVLERRWPETWAKREPSTSKDEEIVVDLVEGD